MAVDSGEARKYKGKSLNKIALEDITFQSAEVGSNEEVDINEGTTNSEVESCHSELKNEKPVSLKRKRALVLSSSSDEENFVQATKSKPQQSLIYFSRATNAEECISYILSGQGLSFG